MQLEWDEVAQIIDTDLPVLRQVAVDELAIPP